MEENKMADRTSEEIKEKIKNLRLSLTIMQLSISDKKEELKQKQKELDDFIKNEWFPNVNKYVASEVPDVFWDRRFSIENPIEDLKNEIQDIQSLIDQSNKRIESLEEELKHAQGKEKQAQSLFCGG